ncbi:hypothetical protein TrLO_g9697 [Triparma laevis f. longispina]|uniref:Uncharacterized protein n=1 Tax=Triparma laevis f. longispina TaxID=1714387 RepID=A0A9W7FH04_9STRA|nr:hypothetical protein TrLO_g9697 [Triparma laevis f. longispina]
MRVLLFLTLLSFASSFTFTPTRMGRVSGLRAAEIDGIFEKGEECCSTEWLNFGWVVICATAYAQGHNLIPDADLPLDLKQWGTLATISGKTTLTNERAIVLIANVHALVMSVCAALAPLPFSDQLLLKDGEEDEKPYGIIPEFKTGLTMEAEIMNGRMAMMGLITVIAASAIEHKSIIAVVNEWLGGAYGNVG